MNHKIILAAGGTGGHINAAIALGEYAKSKHIDVLYFSGQRELDYKLFKDFDVIHLPSLPLRYKNPFKILKSILLNFWSLIKITIHIFKFKPDALIGTGGYVCGAVLFAGFLQRKKIYILEQNSVMGLTNTILANISDKIFYHFKNTRGIKKLNKSICVGNPTRKIQYIPIDKKTDKTNVLIFGGSLGAQEVNELMEYIYANNNLVSFNFIHQTGSKNTTNIKQENGYKVIPYIDDMNYYYNWCDIIISRSGASSISELRIVKKPVYLIPYKFATDNHQQLNAINFKEEENFPVQIYNRDITLEQNAKQLINFLNSNKDFKKMHSTQFASDNSCELIFKEINL